ncbi:hypothetical protein VKT23_020673 [Stygiomarasmius scandens]|uniref:Uncharacterized protein n=1 Tax=Marasmiellus scandens TaxID=2682957 RepID=A0ABR1ILT1_9AGAR
MDSILPNRQYTFSEMLSEIRKLSEEDAGLEYSQFTLTGIRSQHQATVDVTTSTLSEDHSISVSRYYNAFMAIDTRILFKGQPLMVCQYPDPAQVFDTPVCITHHHSSLGRSFPLHRIPNIQLGFFGHHYMLHVFFPALLDSQDYDSAQGPRLSREQEQRLSLYALQPTLGMLCPEDELHIDNTFGDSFCGKHKLVQGRAVEALATTLEFFIRFTGLDWAKGCFYLHTARGLAEYTQHGQTDDALEALMIAEQKIKLNRCSGRWWVVAGLEFSSDRKECLQWMSSSHSRVVEKALEVSEGLAARMTSTEYASCSKRIVSRLTQVSGCYTCPEDDRFGVAHVELLSTDMLSPEGPYSHQAATVEEMLDYDRMSDILTDAKATCYFSSRSVSTNARIEVSDWWDFRFHQLAAIEDIIYSHYLLGPDLNEDGLLMAAACNWVVNSLYSLVDNGTTACQLQKVILRNGVSSRTLGAGMLFLRPIRNILGYSRFHGIKGDACRDVIESCMGMPIDIFKLKFVKYKDEEEMSDSDI